MNAITRRAAAVFLALHGLVHVMGFAAAWQVATLPEISYRTTALNGALEIGDAGARLLGIGWLVAACAFLVVAWGAWRARPWGLRATVLGATVSLVVCVLGLPDAYRGVAIDVAILVGAATLMLGRSVRSRSPVR